MDVPGLADAVHRKRAAAAVTEALLLPGPTKFLFVITLESGRVS